MTPAQAVVLGAVQGLTEFLPVSSSGHLVALAALFGWAAPSTLFSIAVHLGTLLAVGGYFRHDLLALLAGRERRRLGSLLTATLVTAALALAFAPFRDRFVSPLLTAWLLLVFGLVLWLVDARARVRPPFVPRFWASVALGLAQAVALLPGVSRSGIVITVARGFRLSRAAAARYAFLLSAPIIALSPLALLADIVPGETVNLPVVIGFVTAAVFGWLAIALFLRLINTLSFGWVALYRAAVAILIFWRL